MKGVYEFPLKKFYWSTNEFKFAELPEINKEYASKADKIRTPFTGRPEELIQRAKEEEEEGQNTQEDNLDGDQIKDDDNDDFVIDFITPGLIALGTVTMTPSPSTTSATATYTF
mmetsp:Transcript_29554/g.26967  ORF Transcript_29554/g.26967 Transcript_29554/m.26967 type:complete len:114 (+) Transcript_29554:201-542(+)